MVDGGLTSVQNLQFIFPYMGLFLLKLDQHAPCSSISEKAYAITYTSPA